MKYKKTSVVQSNVPTISSISQKKSPHSLIAALSGGVDSSVVAHLLIENGIEVKGVTYRFFEDFDTGDAEAIAKKLGIPYEIIDQRQEFCEKIIDNFIREYEGGNTPNPCVNCNRHMKFGGLLKKAREWGFDGVATGHYAIIDYCEKTERYNLKKATDRTKDQSYFLYMLTQEELAHIYFPLGELKKTQIREIAADNGFINAKRPDSQDICFIPDGDYFSFMQNHLQKEYKQGKILDKQGSVLGNHKGAVAYTLGQRKGLGVSIGKPAYVIEKNMTENTITLGDEVDLYKSKVYVKNLNWIAIQNCDEDIKVMVKLRYSQREEEALLHPIGEDNVMLEFTKPQRAPAPGQAAVFYEDDVVIGGGTIYKAEE